MCQKESRDKHSNILNFSCKDYDTIMNYKKTEEISNKK